MTSAQVDIIIAAVVAFAAFAGMRFGFLRGVSGAICAALTVALMVLGYAPLAGWLRRQTGLAPLPTTLVAFAMLAVLGQLVGIFAIQRPLGPVFDWRDRAPWPRRLDAALGLLVVSLLLVPLAVALPDTPLGPAIREARLAPRLLDADARFLHALRVQPLLQPAVEALALTAPLTNSDRGRQLPADELAPDPAAEAQLLALVNQERACARWRRRSRWSRSRGPTRGKCSPSAISRTSRPSPATRSTGWRPPGSPIWRRARTWHTRRRSRSPTGG